jgi:hypothetical protein
MRSFNYPSQVFDPKVASRSQYEFDYYTSELNRLTGLENYSLGSVNYCQSDISKKYRLTRYTADDNGRLKSEIVSSDFTKPLFRKFLIERIKAYSAG